MFMRSRLNRKKLGWWHTSVIPAKARIIKWEDCGPGWAKSKTLSQKQPEQEGIQAWLKW
jgi:hypothetical protein